MFTKKLQQSLNEVIELLSSLAYLISVLIVQLSESVNIVFDNQDFDFI